MSTDHTTTVAFHTDNHGYPYRATCMCGWQSRGYVSSDAAELMGEDHGTLTPYRDAARDYFA